MRELPDDIQEKYDYYIEFVNSLPLDSDDKQVLIDRVDDIITWLTTREGGWL